MRDAVLFGSSLDVTSNASCRSQFGKLRLRFSVTMFVHK